MASLVVGPGSGGVNILDANIGLYAFLNFTSRTADLARGDFSSLGDPGYVVNFFGNGLTYGSNGLFSGGTIGAITETVGGRSVVELSGISVSGATFTNWINTSNTNIAYSNMFGSGDAILGSPDNDVLKGYGGWDWIDGGGGVDQAVFLGSRSQYYLVQYGAQTVVFPSSRNPVGTDAGDKLVNMETLGFQNGNAANTSPATVGTLSTVNEVFNPLEYVASYPDLIRAIGADEGRAFDHYYLAGYYEGRDTTFSGMDYLASNLDLVPALGMNADAGARHFIQWGQNEGRSVSFVGLEYIASYQDLMNAYGPNGDAGSAHYIQAGRAEGRGVNFNGLEYIASNPDLIPVFGTDRASGAEHFINWGRNEGRESSFNGLEYIASYADLRSFYGANNDAGAAHYITWGRAEGRRESFDGLRYIASNEDLIDAFGASSSGDLGAAHYIQWGANEFRASTTFDPSAYLAKYADLRAVYGNDLEAATMHYIVWGSNEGRTDA